MEHTAHEMHENSRVTYSLIGVKGITQRNERIVYAYLLAHPFSTCNEIKRGLGKEDRNLVAPRLSNLKKHHWVKEFPAKIDHITDCPGSRYVALSESERDELIASLPKVEGVHRSRAYEMGKRRIKALNLAPADYQARVSALATILEVFP